MKLSAKRVHIYGGVLRKPGGEPYVATKQHAKALILTGAAEEYIEPAPKKAPTRRRRTTQRKDQTAEASGSDAAPSTGGRQYTRRDMTAEN